MTVSKKEELQKKALEVFNKLSAKKKFKRLAKRDFKISLCETHDNYTTVILSTGKISYVGTAKCNPNFDEVDQDRGTSIAMSRALSRMLDTKDSGVPKLSVSP